MERRPTTFGMRPDRVVELLRVGSESQSSEIDLAEEQRKAELLRDRLSEQLQPDASILKRFPEDIRRLHNTIGAFVGERIGGLLMDSQTDVGVVRNIKDHSKKLAKSANSEAEYETANTMYYAAIASSLVFHGLRITKFSYKDLHEYLGRLAEEDWIPPELRDLFTKAVQHCKNNMQNKA